MKKIFQVVLIVLLTIIICGSTIALCEDNKEINVIDSNRYSQTRRIYAGLSINAGISCCTGSVTPNNTQSCSLIMRLYKKNGSVWSVVQTWTASATGGQTAYLCKYFSVSPGIYLVVSEGNVAGEISTATSNIVTYN